MDNFPGVSWSCHSDEESRYLSSWDSLPEDPPCSGCSHWFGCRHNWEGCVLYG